MLKINHRLESVVGSVTLAITARAKELKAQGKDVVNFAGGEPDFDTPEAIKKAAVQALSDGITKYTPSTGALNLRQAVSQKFKNENGLDYDPDQIAVSCGAKHSIFNVIQILTDEGEEVIIPAPYWVSYPEMVKLSGATPKIVPTSQETNFKLTAKSLEKNISSKTKLLLLNSPSNPTGMLYSKEELEAIAEVCVKHKIYVLSDEIYEKLIYDVPGYTSFASLGKDIYDLTITVNGVSKAYSMTGWRIGYCGASKEIVDNIKKIQGHSTSNPCSISQMAAIEALQSPVDVIEAMRSEFQARRDLIMSKLDKIKEVSYITPQGAFYLFVNVSKLGEAQDVCKKILNDVNVAVIPGEGFGAPGYARLSFATSQERITEGTRRIAEWITKNK